MTTYPFDAARAFLVQTFARVQNRSGEKTEIIEIDEK
jgi:hypothetical protein